MNPFISLLIYPGTLTAILSSVALYFFVKFFERLPSSYMSIIIISLVIIISVNVYRGIDFLFWLFDLPSNFHF
ncbi:hypothetical protein D0463_02645 [Bacillus sp. V59.32b]|nr:hypothetical protein D0463_02645 [Bacillus sp. V59.32b]